MAFDPIWFARPICHALSLWYKNKQSSHSFRVHWHSKHIDKKKKKEVKRLLHCMALKIHMAWCPEISPLYKTVYGQIWLNILVHYDKKKNVHWSSVITSVGRYNRSTPCQRLLEGWHWKVSGVLCWTSNVHFPVCLSTHPACRVGARPEQNTEIVIGETDYTSYAVLYYQKRGKMTIKLYGGLLMHAAHIFNWLWTDCGEHTVSPKQHFLFFFYLVPCSVCSPVCRRAVRTCAEQVWAAIRETKCGPGLPLLLPHLQYVQVHPKYLNEIGNDSHHTTSFILAGHCGDVDRNHVISK